MNENRRYPAEAYQAKKSNNAVIQILKDILKPKPTSPGAGTRGGGPKRPVPGGQGTKNTRP